MTPGLPLDTVAALVARDLPDGSHVNLGIGLPTLVAGHLEDHRDVFVHSENGVLGVVPLGADEAADPDLVDAGKRPVGLRPGGAYVSHADSFAIIRGGHLDVAVMGAHEVSAEGDLANWSRGEGTPGVGGAMDLAVAVPVVLVMMRHATRDGRPKLVPRLSLPVTARGVVTRVYTEYGVFVPRDDRVVATGLAAGCDVDAVRAVTGVPIELSPGCVRIPVPTPSPSSSAVGAPTTTTHAREATT